MKALLPALALLLCLPCPAQNANALYAQHCAVCHGDKGQGGLGGSLIDGEWKRDASDEALADLIRTGIPDMGMVPYKDLLNERQIRSVVIYLRELENQARRERPARPVDGLHNTQHHNFRLETVAHSPGLMWSLAFLPDGRFLVTEIDGPVRFIEADGTLQEPVRNTPAVVRHGQGGMLEVALHPDFAQNGWIYLAFSQGEGRDAMTSLVRGRIRDNTWVDEEILYRAKPEQRRNAGVHFGSRIDFHKGYVFFSIGDRGADAQAQSLDRPNGKIHRLHDDGRIPADNPFVGKAGVESIWSYGHRNPQALTFRPGGDELWSTEHGPRGGDELNRILPGRNYGWPTVTHGMNYNGTPITEHTQLPGIEPPIWHWTPSIAVCGMAFLDSARFPKWKGDLFVGGLRAELVERIRLGEKGLVEREAVLQGQGRVRDVRAGPDGLLYLLLEGNGSRIVRLRPGEEK
jgi:glucose/arabinose dehydrogenase